MGFGAQAAQASSSSYGYNISDALSTMNSGSTGTSTSQSGQNIWGPQANQLKDLYGATGDLAQAQSGEAAKLGQQLATDLGRMGQGYQQTLQGLADPTAQIKAQEASLKSGLGSLFRDEINPNLTAGAVGAGGMGGGRQGVAQGVATGQLADAYTQGLGDITAAANAQAGTAASAGLSSLPMMQNLGMSGLTSAWLPYQMQAGILGGPTALGSSSSKSKNKSKSKAKSGSSSRSEQSAESDSFSVGVSVGV